MRWMRGQILFSSKTVDTDVVVILVGIFHDLAQHHHVGFSTGKHFRYYHINSICQELGEEKARTLPLFTPSRDLMQHPSSAVKVKSQPGEHGKHILQPLLGSPTRLRMDLFLWNLHLQHSDWFSDLHVRQYDMLWQGERPSARGVFPTRVKMMEKLPPTETALLQHANRCLYQASIWKNSLKPFIAAPNPEGFRWTREDTGWHPVWTTLPAAAVVGWKELIKCDCKAGPTCARKCRCKTAGLTCTALCLCRVLCES